MKTAQKKQPVRDTSESCPQAEWGATHRKASPLQLTREVDYGVRVMIHLAGRPEHDRAQLDELAAATGAPKSFLSKVLQSLCHAQFVSSQRGSSGGFTILPAGRQASIASVFEAIEGAWTLNVCLTPGDSCSRKGDCPAHPVWAAAQKAMLGVLRAQTVQDLATHPARRRPPAQH
jgi:Rrf2 family protein